MNGRTNRKIILSKGAGKAALTFYDYSTDSIEALTDLPENQYVYSADCTSDDNLIAAGTKQGSLYWLNRQTSIDSCNYEVRKLVQRIEAPILSVCFLDSQNLAVSDISGRCFICSPKHDRIRVLDSDRDMICSLFCPEDRYLAGLSVTGRLFIWDWRESGLIKKIQVPAPAEVFCALINVVYWPAKKVWLWPASGGAVAFYRWPDNEVRSISAYKADVSSIIVCDEKFLTITGNKTHIDCWDMNFRRTAVNCNISEGVISGCAFGPRQQRKILLLDDRGKVGMYTFNNGDLEYLRHLQTDNICTLIGPDLEVMDQAEKRQKQIRAEELSIEITQRLQGKVRSEDMKKLHSELIELGYEHVSLGLMAGHYRNNKKVISELATYRRLISLCEDRPDVLKSSLPRYAVLLERLWQSRDSLAIYHKLLQYDPNNSIYHEKIDKLNKCIEIMETDDYAIVSDVALSSLICSSTLLNRPFQGRYHIRDIEESLNCNVVISADEFIDKLYQLFKSKYKELPSRIVKLDLWWLKTNTIEKVHTVIVENLGSGPLGNIELSVRLKQMQFQSIVTTSVLLNSQVSSDNVSIRQHNDCILKQYQQIEDENMLRGWLKVIYGDLREALRQTITRAVALRNR